METVRLSDEDVIALLTKHESHFFDFKDARIAPATLSKTISAFANSSGGEIVVGVEEEGDDKVWNGFPDFEAANPIFQMIETIGQGIRFSEAQFLQSSEHNGLLLHLLVPKNQNVICATDGLPRVRRNAQNITLQGEQIDRLKYDKGVRSFEDEIVKIPLDAVSNSVEVIEFMIEQVPSAEPLAWLSSQFIVIEGYPTVAATLLFADTPQAALPKRSAIKIYRYATVEDTLDRAMLAGEPLTIEGPIYELIRGAVEAVKNMIETIKRMTEDGLESVVYPEETLHEIITNAVLHRDYSIATDTQIRIYDDRVEVESPGRFPGHVTKDNFLDEQFARNPKIVRLINKFPNPPNKDVGEGFNTAFEAMRKIRLADPEVIEKDTSVLVVIRHQRLASPAQIVMEYIEAHGSITNVIGREITGLRRDVQMKDVFVALRKRDLIEIVPGTRGRATAWQSKT